jgi:hypothetical protein
VLDGTFEGPDELMELLAMYGSRQKICNSSLDQVS